jgi:multidrug efflux pump subunit AcrA (membrane-fusion protein)
VKTSVKWIIFLLAIAFLIGAGIVLFSLGTRRAATTDTTVRPAVPVTAIQLEPRRFVSRARYSARLAAASDVTVTARVTGTIEEDVFSEGAKVKEGQALFRIDEDSYRFAMEQAEATLDLARENLRKTRNISRPELIHRLKAMVVQMESALDKAASDARRYEELYRQGAIPLSRKEDADLALVASRSQLEIARRNLEEANAGARDEDQAAAEAGVRQAEAALHLARDRWEDTVIRSPISGTVAVKKVFLGDTVQPGRPVAEIVDLSTFRIEVGVSGSDVLFFAAGDTVAVDAGGDTEEVPAVVMDVGVKADGKTGAFPVILRMENPDDETSRRRYRAGMDVTVSFTRIDIPGALAVPATAVLTETERQFVFVAADGAAHRRDVTVGPRANGEAVVTTGLSDGELVVVVGQKQLRDGDRVELTVEE